MRSLRLTSEGATKSATATGWLAEFLARLLSGGTRMFVRRFFALGSQNVTGIHIGETAAFGQRIRAGGNTK